MRLVMTDFYSSKEWHLLKQQCLQRWGLVCLKCAKTPADGVTIQVDHIEPRSLFPQKALKLSNLQPLCESCNKSKGVTIADYRPKMISKVKKALTIIAMIALTGFVFTHQAIKDPLLELAKPHIAKSLGLLTADLCEATVMP